MSMKIYVGNLAYSVDNSALQDLFSVHGTVESAAPRRRPNGVFIVPDPF